MPFVTAWFAKILGFIVGFGSIFTSSLNPSDWVFPPQTSPSSAVGNSLYDRQIWPSVWWKFTPNESAPPWRPYGIPVGKRHLPSPTQIPMLPLNGECKKPQDVLEAKLHQAFLVTDPIDVLPNDPQFSDFKDAFKYHYKSVLGDIPYGKFLVVQAFMRNVGSVDQGAPNSLYLALSSPGDSTKQQPLLFGGHGVFGWETAVHWALFPVRPSETFFTLYYCDQNKPTMQTIDFSSPDVQKIRGTYSMSFGLYME